MIQLDKDTYSKQEVEEIIKPYNSEIAELKNVLVDTNKLTEEISTLKKTSLKAQIEKELMKSGLDDSLFDLVDSTDVAQAQSKITKLVEMKKKQLMKDGFKPEDHNKDNEYEKAIAEKNTEKAISSKLSKFFGKD